MPPNRRVVEVSACSKVEKTALMLWRCRCRCRSRRTAMLRWPLRTTRRHAQATSPASVNLKALPTRLTHHLPQTVGIARPEPGQLAAKHDKQVRAPSVGSTVTTASAFERSRKSNARRRVELARLDLREIENVVDDRQQRLGRLTDCARSSRRCRSVEFGSQQQFGHADDAVHGRANFVAHVGEEFAFSLARLFGRLLGSFESAS